MNLKPIGLSTQIEDVLTGTSLNDKEALIKKVLFVKDNVNKITKINKSKVYRVIVKGDCIYYYLSDYSGIEYYYPIKYANISFI